MAAAMPPAKKQDRSRDEAALGGEVLSRFSGINVLIAGPLRSLGVETAKNVILTGPKVVSLWDPEPATVADIGLNYYVTPESVGQSRAAASLAGLQELNEFVSVRTVPALDEETVARHQAAVFIGQPRADLLRWNEFCRARGIAFYAADVRGVAGFIFADLGDAWTVNDKDGENLKSAVVFAIEAKAGDAGRLSVITDASQNKMHGFADGDFVVFSEVQGMTRLNDGVPRRIAATQPFGFEVVLAEGDAAETYGRHTGGGMVSQRKVPTVVSFAPLSTRIPQPLPTDDPMGMLITPDLGKWGRSEQLHAFFQALDSFRERHAGDLPAPRNAEHAAEVVALAKEFAAGLKDKEGAMQLEAVDEAALSRLAGVAAYELPALGTFFSGVLAQELVKLTGKYAPLRQWLYYDCAEVLAKPEAEAAALAADPAEFTPRGSRYDHNIGLFGRSLQDKLLGTKVFLVGCGALGCELIKNFALMGVGCGPEGRVTATDMDIIETSNLSRQFLYRARHVGSAKSVTACNEVKRMNADIKTVTLEVPVGPTTEGVFTDAFWAAQDVVVNALDNIEARKYVDRKCIAHARPMLDSGTLGTKANTQIVVPFLTEAYSDSQDEQINETPMCTVRELPYLPEHCIEYGRNLFAQEFFDGVRGAVAFAEDPAGWVAAQLEKVKGGKPQPSEAQQVLKTLQAARAPSPDGCVAAARLLFNRVFYDRIRTVQHNLPEDMVDAKTGARYWIGRRRFPHPLEFSLEDAQHRDFIVHTAALYAAVYGVAMPEGWEAPEALAASVAKVAVPEWKPTKLSTGDEDKGEGMSEFADPAAAVHATLAEIEALVAEAFGGSAAAPAAGGAGASAPSKLASLPLHPQEFEKDDDANHHIDFMHSVSNLRSLNYNIPQSDRLTVRVTAGRIIPAIATTTTSITGLVSIELWKLLQGGRPVDDFRNAFVNLGINAYNLSEPGPARKVRSRKHSVTYGGPVRAVPEGWTHWHHVVAKGPATPASVVEQLAAEHGLRVVRINTTGVPGKRLFIKSLKAHQETRLHKPLRDLYVGAGFAIAEGQAHLDLLVEAEDEASPVQLPPLRVHLA